MVEKRLVPVLLIRNDGLMKSTQFGDWKYVGDPLNTAKIFNDKDTDELIILDVDATDRGRGPNFNVLKLLAAECFLPIAYGGGVSSVEHALELVRCGVDKVSLNSAALENPELVLQISEAIGASSTVLSVDVFRRGGLFYVKSSKEILLEEYLEKVGASGAGELIVQSMDQDGTLSGPDLELVRLVASNTEIPLVYAGGIASLQQAQEVWRLGVDAVAAGAWFVFSGSQRAVLINYPQRKRLELALKDL